ncbi:ubiquitin carboxyl-terminal hydrolase [Xylaria digitata]|nr:ubiquitin carboxyl-terminal hydrolase [Xylaria digitata]
MEENNIMAASPNPYDGLVTNAIRRSARTRKVPAKYDEEYVIPSKQPSQPSFTAATDRPKRKAAEAAREQIVSEEVASLQEEIFAHMDIDERKEYRGWVELESEPAFFNAMLQDLGAKSLKVQEMFALDEVILAGLPKPVYGLIFLYEWTNEDESNEARQACPENLWFGNQTTANACATVALMNIIMNARSVEFGPELEEFRSKTKLLPPPHRGHALDTNDFIRAIHNSVARRNDLLSEDLLLDNQFEAASKKKTPPKRRKKIVKNTKNKRNSKNSKYEAGTYHYIAFVPVDGQVWELDGLENMPLCLGPYTGEAWLGVASEAIQNRMRRQNNDFLSFNLLAICQSPLVTISRNLATSFATTKALDEVVAGAPSWENFHDDRLARFNLTREQILTQYSPHPSFDARVNDPNFDLAAARKFAEELRTEQEALEAQYIVEVGTVDEAVEMIRARRRDYTPAVHEWVRVLAEAGVLRELIEEMDSPS